MLHQVDQDFQDARGTVRRLWVRSVIGDSAAAKCSPSRGELLA